MTYVSLPRELTLDDGLVYIQHWKSAHYAIYQNYSTKIESGEPFQTPQVSGENWFNVYRVVEVFPAGEELGSLLGRFSNLEAAMNDVARREQLE